MEERLGLAGLGGLGLAPEGVSSPPLVLSVQSPLMGERENLLASGDSRVGREDGLDFLFQSVPYFLQYKRWKEKGGGGRRETFVPKGGR